MTDHPFARHFVSIFARPVILGFAMVGTCAAQVNVNAARQFVVQTAYEDLVAELGSESSVTALFRSQDVHLTQYQMREQPQASSDRSDDGVRATVDIGGNSAEYGCLQYVLSFEAKEKQTVVRVQLVRGGGKLVGQSYCFFIVPLGDDACNFRIDHSLTVSMKKRRLQAVNRIVEKVTRTKACEIVNDLTQRMSCAAGRVSTQIASKATESNTIASERSIAETAVSNPAPINPAPAYSPPTMELRNKKTVSLPPDLAGLAETNSALPSISRTPTLPAASAMKEGVAMPSLESGQLATSSTVSSTQLEQPLSRAKAPGADAIAISATPPPVSRVPVASKRTSQARQLASKPVELPTESKGNTLTVSLTGIAQSTGDIRIALFNSRQQFDAFDPRKPESVNADVYQSVSVAVTAANRAQFVHEFKDVVPGKYSIGAFHDLNGNKILDSNFLGLPSEPYGFSRDGRRRLSLPPYESVEIQVDSDNTRFQFRVR